MINNLRIKFVPLIPFLNWTLAISVVFCFVIALGEELGVSFSKYEGGSAYVVSLSFIIPILLFQLLLQNSKNIFVFILGSLIMLGVYGSLCFLFSMIEVWYFLVFLFIAFYYVLAGIERKESIFYYTSYGFYFFFLPLFIASIFIPLSELQIYILLNSILIFFLNFLYIGMERVDRYLMIRKSKANLPEKAIGNQGFMYYVLMSVVGLMITLATLVLCYEEIIVSIPISYLEEREVLEVEEEADEIKQQGVNFDALQSFARENSLDTPFWNFSLQMWRVILFLLFYVMAPVILILLLRALLLTVIKSWQRQVVRSTDSKKDYEEVKENLSLVIPWKEKIRDSFETSIFGTSKEAKVRRAYRNRLKKYKPYKWQSPSEMEEMAGIHIGDLHEEYEKARYGEN